MSCKRLIIFYKKSAKGDIVGNDYEWSEYSKNKAVEKQQKKKEKKKHKEIGEMNMSEEMNRDERTANRDERTVKHGHWN